MDKKICVVSMSVGKPASMTAAWINNELVMAERTSYPERRRDMELQLLRELREKEEKGFIVLVEEENSFITGRVGQRVRLRDPFMNGRPVLIEANNNVVSADYIRTMTDTVTKQDNEYSPYEPFVNMIKAFYRMELTKVPQGKLTGKDNIF
ncbi:maturation control protein [Escherichia coli]|nr:maturation control protein [Escherichia coli]